VQRLGLPWVAQLLTCLFSSITDERQWRDVTTKSMLERLRTLPLLPLADNTFVSLSLGSRNTPQDPAPDRNLQPPLQPLQPQTAAVYFSLQAATQEALEGARQRCGAQQQDQRLNPSEGGAVLQNEQSEASVRDGKVQACVDADLAKEPVQGSPNAEAGAAAEEAATARQTSAAEAAMREAEARAVQLAEAQAAEEGVESKRANTAAATSQQLLQDSGLDWRQLQFRQLHPLLLLQVRVCMSVCVCVGACVHVFVHVLLLMSTCMSVTGTVFM
jgi:hypothetical protein